MSKYVPGLGIHWEVMKTLSRFFGPSILSRTTVGGFPIDGLRNNPRQPTPRKPKKSRKRPQKTPTKPDKKPKGDNPPLRWPERDPHDPEDKRRRNRKITISGGGGGSWYVRRSRRRHVGYGNASFL